jgi:hypothetical protein
MEKIHPKSALYIKLGEKGLYEEECLTSPGKLHVGWTEVPHELCISGESGDWDAVKQIELEISKGNKATATNQTNQLKSFYESDENVLWITFDKEGFLYWCFADSEILIQPDKSRARLTHQGWHKQDIHGRVLDSSRLSGSLLAIQGFRSTICKVREFEYVVRKINCESSPSEQKAIEAREALIQSLVSIIQSLNWKEFELLTDLIFRQIGWQRLDVLGIATKSIDLDLLSPIGLERYRVQVKAKAGMEKYRDFLDLASNNEEFARYFFVVHSPEASLVKQAGESLVKVWLPEDITRLVVNYGLVDWLIAKAK